MLKKVLKNRPVWYTNSKFIRKKKNYHWTPLEIFKVYSLRISGYSSDEIIKLINPNLTRYKVYNIIRIMKKNINNKCHQCGSDLSNEEIVAQENKHYKKCSICKKKESVYKKKIRRSFMRHKLCAVCGVHKPKKGETTCIYCRSYSNRHRLVEGFCGTCGKHPINFKRSISLCDLCLDLNLVKSAAISKI